MSRGRAMRAQRRAEQFAKFRITQLNLVPLVDAMTAIVFFALTVSTVGALAPVVPGVTLPESRVGNPAFQQLTLGIGAQITVGGHPVMNTVDAARARSTDPAQPLLIPRLYDALRQTADSLRRVKHAAASAPVPAVLAIQGDRTMRYDLLSRVMQTARMAGFRDLTLQVARSEAPLPGATTTPVRAEP
ncbi:MAG TPA: biopolymer transporter ExbD [Gemmatimonadaceae bacterium]|nr:biopolymer transporter ExbD [Gemmatimonadaceae bacterium]